MVLVFFEFTTWHCGKELISQDEIAVIDYLVATRGTPFFLREIRHYQTPEIQISFRLWQEKRFWYGTALVPTPCTREAGRGIWLLRNQRKRFTGWNVPKRKRTKSSLNCFWWKLQRTLTTPWGSIYRNAEGNTAFTLPSICSVGAIFWNDTVCFLLTESRNWRSNKK